MHERKLHINEELERYYDPPRPLQKVERRLCAEAEMLEFLEKVYGPTESETLQELGLPENKYAAAGIAAAVLSNAESPEERFVDEFMWRLDDNL